MKSLAAGLGLLLLAGCAPVLRVAHRDVRAGALLISVDGRPVGTVTRGATLTTTLARGPHALDVQDPASGERRWTDDGAPCELVVDGDVDVTIVTPGTR